jgi:hypothetical protein
MMSARARWYFARGETLWLVGVCRRGTEGVQDELNRDVKLRKR